MVKAVETLQQGKLKYKVGISAAEVEIDHSRTLIVNCILKFDNIRLAFLRRRCFRRNWRVRRSSSMCCVGLFCMTATDGSYAPLHICFRNQVANLDRIIQELRQVGHLISDHRMITPPQPSCFT